MKWTNSYRSFGLKTKRSTGLKTIEHKQRDTRVTNLDECERMIETARADTAILLVGGKERDATENGEGDDPPGPRNGKRPQSRPARIQAQVLPAIGKGVRRRSGGSPSPRSRTRPAGRRSLFRLTLESFLSPSRTHGPDSARFSPIQLVPHSFPAAP